ncbi:MAG: YceI family protein [Bacteroidia bacterium]|nr:YceI family protein [Bacteroidia bacterium]NNC86462.1 YceI family protein [Bacteroidia bacterium]NNM15010.1 YceI family protein [Bacteroidia bacterium]
MKKIFFIAVAFILSGSVVAQSEWVTDAAHTTLQFSVSHLVISEATGNFKNFEAVVATNNEEFNDAKIQISVMVESLDTDDKTRDQHLLSEDFFDVKSFPAINFESTSFKKIKDNNYKLIGNLTIKDVTKEVEFDVTHGGTVTDPYGVVKAGFKLEGKVNRFDYGLKWNTLLESGGAVVGEEVSINCNIQLKKL